MFYTEEDAAAGQSERELEMAAREGRFEDEGWRVRKDGSRFWANVVITPLRTPEGALIGFAKVTRDLTERRQAEENLRALVAAERAASAEKSRVQEFQERFLAILGHDLRQPLASIEMAVRILRMRSKEPAIRRVVDRMGASLRRMSRMIEQILDFTRSRLGGGLELVFAPMDLHEALTPIVDELRTAHPSATIQLQCPELRGAWDRDRLEQVFSNLIGNALVHGDPGKPVTVTAGADALRVWVEVHNEGPPIPQELQSVLFHPFRRGERESREPGGARPGSLHLERSGPRAWRADRDSINRSRRNDVSSRLAAQAVGNSGRSGRRAMSHTVLVVEDEVDLREMMCEALELHGFAVVAATDGKDALDKVTGIENLCLVILDLLMPEMNGWDFVEQLRKRSEFATVPIIVHTSSPHPAPATVARVLRKPAARRHPGHPLAHDLLLAA